MTHLAVEPFAPLGAAEIAPVTPPPQALVPIVPVPDDAPEASFHHFKHGAPFAVWTYRDAERRVLGHVARFDTPDGKQILPRSWCRSVEGPARWAWKALPAPRPLYGLDRLASIPNAPVLVVEGEKTADASQERFLTHVVTTWPGGSKAAGKADWTALRGRDVIIWPDADEPGRKAGNDVAAMARAAGAKNIAVVTLGADLPEGWDLADPVPHGLDPEALLASAVPTAGHSALPAGYAITSRGLVWRDPEDEEKPEYVLADPIEIVAETRDLDGTAWGVLLRWKDHDGRTHDLALPRASLAGDGADARRLLLDGGLYVTPNRKGRERLTAFLTSVRSPGRVTATSRIGWHKSTFVLPDACIGPGSERLMLQGSGAVEHAFRRRGSLAEWKAEVARYAPGNSRLVLSISAAFAATLVGPCDAESGGVHLRGASSTGKSTALAVAGSVWGGGQTGGYVRSWRATANGLEGVAVAHCDALLCLNELAQISAREAGEVAYLLANGSGKSRSARDGAARRAARWRVLFLSSGEIGLADKVMEDGKKRLAAGQHVRIVDIAADAGAGLGLFENLHGFPSADALARHLRSAATSVYGLAAPVFLESIAGDLDRVRGAVAQHTSEFVRQYVPFGADGQVHRVAQRFGLIATGGELAVAAGVLPWPPGEAFAAAARCFTQWLVARGGIEPAEVREGIGQVRSFLLAHGMARFAAAWEINADQRLPLRDLVGFRKRAGEGWDFYVTPSAWREEVCAGLNAKAVAGTLAERGMLILPEKGPHRAKSETVSGYGKLRVYHIPARFLEEDGHD